MDISTLYAVLLSLVAGIIWATFGYWKARQKGEPFSGFKFIRAVVIGACVGLISFLYGWSFDTSMAVLTELVGAFGATGFIDWIAAEIWKRIAPTPDAEKKVAAMIEEIMARIPEAARSSLIAKLTARITPTGPPTASAKPSN